VIAGFLHHCVSGVVRTPEELDHQLCDGETRDGDAAAANERAALFPARPHLDFWAACHVAHGRRRLAHDLRLSLLHHGHPAGIGAVPVLHRVGKEDEINVADHSARAIRPGQDVEADHHQHGVQREQLAVGRRHHQEQRRGGAAQAEGLRNGDEEKFWHSEWLQWTIS
jgi:hypothetical protein